MKKILLILFIFSYNAYSKSIINNEYIYNEIEKIALKNIDELKKTLNNLDEEEVNLGFYTSNDYIKSKKKINLTIKEALVNEDKINILSEDYDSYKKVLEKQNNSNYEDIRLLGQLKKTKFLLKTDYINLVFNRNFYLKDELKGILSLEVINLSSGEVVFTSNNPINIVKKVKKNIIYTISAGLLFLGILFSFITKKYYTIKIMFLSIILILTLNFYYFYII